MYPKSNDGKPRRGAAETVRAWLQVVAELLRVVTLVRLMM